MKFSSPKESYIGEIFEQQWFQLGKHTLLAEIYMIAF